MAILSPAIPTQRTTQYGVWVIALAALMALLYYGRDFFVTLIVSAVFSFMLDPVVQLIMRLRLPRSASTAIVIGVAVGSVYILCLIGWTQLLTIREDLPTYTSRINELIDKANTQLGDVEQKTIALVVPQTLRQQEQAIQQKPQEAMKARRRRAGLESIPIPATNQIQEVRIHENPKPVLGTLLQYVSGYFHLLVLASFVPFLVYFMLSWRDHISHSFLGLFKDEHQYVVGRSWLSIGDSTRAYVLGNFLLWIFVSSISAIAFFFLQVPYWPLIGPVSAFLSLVPYVGLPLAVVPPVLAALAIPNKFKVVVLIMAITAALHVGAMNFLYPKIIGRRVKLNPLVVTVALMFWGLLWGGIGLVLAVPITAGIKAVCDNVESMHNWGRILGDD